MDKDAPDLTDCPIPVFLEDSRPQSDAGKTINFLEVLKRISVAVEEICTVRLGSEMVVFVLSPEFVHSVLVEKSELFEKTPLLRTRLGPLLGNGLLTSTNAFNKRQRRLIAPALQRNQIGKYADMIVANAEEMQAFWNDGSTVDVAKAMVQLTLKIIGKALFNVEILDTGNQLGRSIVTALQWANNQFSTLNNSSGSESQQIDADAINAIATLDLLVYEAIRKRRTSSNPGEDILSALVMVRDEVDGTFLDDGQIRDEVITLLLAGHEAVANALDWSWYLLASNPSVQAKFADELNRVLAGRTATFDDLANLPFTLQVLKEAMRLYPPAPTFGRQATADVRLGRYLVSAGTVVSISPFAIHRRRQYFANPSRFDPDHFLPLAERLRPRYAYIPFGGGSRICVGNHFAMMASQLILATIGQRVLFRTLPDDVVEPESVITLRPKGGLSMLVVRRAQHSH